MLLPMRLNPGPAAKELLFSFTALLDELLSHEKDAIA